MEQVTERRVGERLWWENHHEDDGVVLVLHGDLDLSTEAVLRTALRTADAARRTGDALLVDLDDVAFCAARGLTVLGGTAQRCARGGVRFGLRRCPAQVLRMLDLLALRHVLEAPDTGAQQTGARDTGAPPASR